MSTPVALTVPLHGLHLIEASAGTGKTWTLAGLYLRLVLERGLQPRQILTLTFTEAATAELRERIRLRLQDMQDLLGGHGVGDPFCQAVQARLVDPALAQQRLCAALRSLDEAAIHTIHGFCQRALADRRFDTGSPVDAEIAPDTGPLLREILLDFWRRRLAVPDPAQTAFAGWLQERKDARPDLLQKWLSGLLNKPGLEIRRGIAGPQAGAAQSHHATVREACAQMWQSQREDLLRLLTTHPALSHKSYKPERVPDYFAELDAFLTDAGAVNLPKHWPLFTASRIDLQRKGKNAPPSHRFFDLADQLVAATDALLAGFDQRWRELRLELHEYARSELPRRLRERRQMSFAGLLVNLHGALHGSGHEELAQTLRARFPAALIDEFQDTDPLQWGILRRLYVDAPALDPPLAAFFVGDPKQAIYSFRGADIYTYLDAARSGLQPHTLSENQRSVPGYLAALNALYGRVANPFRHAQIAAVAVTASPREKPALVEDGVENPAPLRVFFCAGKDDGRPESKTAGADWACHTTAAEIARLLSAAARGDIRLGGRPLQAADLAVLVNNRYQASAVRQALARRGIASALRSHESVFHGDEAEQLERLLLAVAQPHRERLLRTALAGELLGWSAQQISALDADESAWDEQLARFAHYHDLWRDRGFMRMLRELLRAEGVYERLAATPDGERRLSNLLHLTELLHAGAGAHPGMQGLLTRLAAGRGDNGGTDNVGEDAQLRLESDAGLVQISTLHVSKGLEYPVCFLPFLWNPPSHLAAGLVVHHDAAPPHALVLDAGSANADQAALLARDESHAEHLRLAYVGLTRASHRTYVFSGHFNEVTHSAPGLLLHGIEDADADADALDGPALRCALDDLCAVAAGNIRVQDDALRGDSTPPAAPAVPELAARRLHRRPPGPLDFTSYTRLLDRAEVPATDDLPDHDQRVGTTEPAAATAPGGDRFGFPRGAAAGICLHEILRRMDLSAPPQDWDAILAAQLLAARFPAAWLPALRHWLTQLMRAPLPALAARGEFCLADLTPPQCIREMGFRLPLHDVAPAQITALARRHGLSVSALASQQLDGYLGGFIDLLFVHQGRWYLADYKSTWLGAALDDYTAATVARAMDQNDYPLQYLLYTVALHRWLRSRIADYAYARDVGGVLYLFLRGMAPDARDADGAPLGVHATRPPQALVEALDALLAGQAHSA